jgi:predicted dehydrogenase
VNVSTRPAKVGIIGCGNISGIYLKNGKILEALEIVACADLDMERAKAKATECEIEALSVDALLAHPEIEVVINLTVPKAHGAVAVAALEAGKSVYNEKPLGITREEGKRIVELAAAKGLYVGCAPDTFLGAGLQTCRKLIEDGAIGRPIGATAFMAGRGPEGWHPNPEFFYQVGGGPMFDMGPYYLTAMVSLLGPVKRATGSAQISFAERIRGSEPKKGAIIPVEIPTHIAGVLDFAAGAVGMILTSFDVWAANLPRIEIYGSEGSLSVPDPNTFGGPVRIRRSGDSEWQEVPLTHPYAENSRGIGVADLVSAMRSGRPNRASGELAYHVLDIMHAIHDASREGKHIEMTSTCRQPAPLPVDLEPGTVD